MNSNLDDYNLDIYHHNSKLLDNKAYDLDKLDNIDEDNECSICCNDIKEGERVTLKCGHFFHYDCIMSIFKNDNSRYYKSSKNVCPYCRKPSGYIPLKPGVIPVKYIHKEYNEYIKTNDIKKYLVKGVCGAILKSGKNAGCQCKKPLDKNSDFYCTRHLKYYKCE